MVGGERPLTRIVDLSAPIAGSPPGVPVFQRNEVEYFDHAAGAREIEEMFGVPARLLRDGEGWSRETVTLGTHNSTHVDAPYHYNSRIAGAPAATIDELPLERFYGPGVVLDFTARADGEAIDAADVQAALAAIPHTLAPGDIVLIHTGRDAFYGQPDYMHRGPGVTAAATRWMYEQGVRVMGIDAWGWDRPLRMQAADALERDEPGIFWEAHQADLDYSQIERLVNLGELPPTGFTVACFPLPIVRASAAPARVVAIFD
ncbi:MAG TPA: cyclase family protein [Solirubrobacter sp.]|nr:cyclase family protein [Solirubrobacter sp.]